MTNTDTTEQSIDDSTAAADEAVTDEAVTDEAVTDEAVTDEPATRPDSEDRLVAEGEIAGDYLEELLDLLDFDGDIDLDVEGSRAVVSIDGGEDLLMHCRS
jgi:spoIIIJ-associated protein